MRFSRGMSLLRGGAAFIRAYIASRRAFCCKDYISRAARSLLLLRHAHCLSRPLRICARKMLGEALH